MKKGLAIALAIILTAIAGLHLYWGLGGFWPGSDEASLVDKVIGAPAGTPIPPLWACLVVVVCLLIPAAAMLFVSCEPKPRFHWSLAWIPVAALWCSAFVFIARGLVTYLSPIFEGGNATAFYQLNLVVYSPLCLALGLGLIAIALWPPRAGAAA